jgi:hypothetical protein
MNKIKEWFGKPLTRKDVKVALIVLSLCLVANIGSAIIAFNSGHIAGGLVNVSVGIWNGAFVAIFSYGLKNIFKEEN